MIVKLMLVHCGRSRFNLFKSVLLRSPPTISCLSQNVSFPRRIFTYGSTTINENSFKLISLRTFHLSSNVNCNQNKSHQTENDKKLVITERCLNQLNQILEPGEYIRVGVRGGGCSGFEYEINVNKESDINQDDLLIEGRVIVDRESIEYMNGAKLDYEDELIRSGFRVIDNPLADKGCSCGASFSFKF